MISYHIKEKCSNMSIQTQTHENYRKICSKRIPTAASPELWVRHRKSTLFLDNVPRRRRFRRAMILRQKYLVVYYVSNCQRKLKNYYAILNLAPIPLRSCWGQPCWNWLDVRTVEFPWKTMAFQIGCSNLWLPYCVIFSLSFIVAEIECSGQWKLLSKCQLDSKTLLRFPHQKVK